ncbi:H(+)-transporting ATP synthase, vacuolar type, subunit D [Croceitalea dokdonensis DOKDO 023]|uniref:H(+)-transporting ATP synthase, vacuolar type, subunit D n=1 Tax=Croceitalea dokdonensis DOKDO 023 TaxID=1300341 RepID=A0A0P7AFJ6_9FLAO|nr:V-type ATP synthase subunit D [Croceitalea dokdonensis]KPM30881.1 H(+)-transporting ATP synthase, vacuolar type, subunit D [Croceitalea dokdonensis DOKDO 023]
MADKILMNKNTLAALKVELKEYHTALPVFEMKEQKLKEVVQATENKIARLKQAIDETNEQTKEWVAVMAEENVALPELAKVDRVVTETKEIAGVSIKVFEDIVFEDDEVDLFNTPLWIDRALDVIREQKTNRTLVEIENSNLKLLWEELAEARRMKNALKEVFIPETQENIRKIEIYLGDVERLAIGCAKLVKKKKEGKKATV